MVRTEATEEPLTPNFASPALAAGFSTFLGTPPGGRPGVGAIDHRTNQQERKPVMTKSISPEERDRRAEAVHQARHSIEMEQGRISPSAMAIQDTFANGTIDSTEATGQIRALHGLDG